MFKRARSAITGRFVKAKYAVKHPYITTTETYDIGLPPGLAYDPVAKTLTGVCTTHGRYRFSIAQGTKVDVVIK